MTKKQGLHERKTIILRTFLTILLASLGFMVVRGQQVRIETKATSQISLPKNAIQRLLVQSDGKILIGHILRSKDTLIVALPGKKLIRLPYRFQAIISYDGSTIIQYGDKMMLDLPKHLDVYWINNAGKEKAEVVNHYSGDTYLDMSSDGYTAIGGTLLDKSNESTISVYSPDGIKLWETKVANNRHVAQLNVTKLGSTVVVVTTDAQKKLDKHQLDIYDGSGKLQSEIKDLGIIQRVVIVGNETKLFFQGLEYYGMIDATSGRVLWKSSRKLTMVSPYGAALSPDGKKLFLVVVQPEGKRTGTYQWKFIITDASTGQEMGSQIITGKYPATWGRIFESVNDNSITVLASDARIIITVGSEKGGSQ